MKSKLLKLLLMTLKGSFYGVVIQTIFFTAIHAGEIHAQRIESVRKVSLDVRLENSDLFEAFKAIEEKTSFKFAYDHEDLNKEVRIDFNKRKATVADLLLEISRSSNLKFRQVNDLINVNIRDRKHTKDVIEVIIQGRTITGKVTSSEDNEGLPGVNVIVKGTSQGTVTDVEGNYSLEVPGEESVLVFSSVGYVQEEVVVGTQTVINFSMVPDITALEEIVVVGYGVRNRATLAGSVAKIDEKAFEGRPVTNAVSALQGTVPGLVVTQSSSQPGNEGWNLRLRGLSSVNGGNSPLVLVDGFQSSFSTLNPDDIESISVVKDGAAAIYGNQAANGVVLITTKSGAENMKPTVDYNFTYGMNTPTYIAEKMTTGQYMEVVNAGYVNDGAAPLYGDIFFDALGTDQVLNFNQTRLGGAEREDSWLVFNQSHNQFVDEIFENGTRQNHNLSISGGGQNATYRLSFGYLGEDGVINTEFDGYKRYNLRLNNTFNLSKKLKLTTQNSFELGDRSASTELGTALSRIPLNWTLAPVRRQDGEYYTFRGFVNSLDLLKQGGEAKTISTRFISNIKLDYEIIEGLTATGNFGINYNSINNRNEVPTIRLINEWTIDDTPGTRIQPNTNPNRLIEEDSTITYGNFNAYLSYVKTLAENHNLNLTTGFSHEQRKNDFKRAEARDFPTNDLFSLALGDVNEARVDGDGYAWTLRSWFGRFNYTFKDKYIAEATLRYDGSSRFTSEERWGLFPGYLVAWRASEEDFIRNMNFFDNLKLRASYGETGNQQGIGFYDYLALINVNKGILFGPPSGGMFGNQTEHQTYTEAGAVSLDRTWETIATTNFGVDIGIFNAKLNMSFDYFFKLNKDLLVRVDLPEVLGTNPPALNKGELETKGWELMMSWNDNIGDFNYFLTGVLFNDQNTLTKLEGSSGVKREGINNRLEGYSVGTYFGWKYDGIIQDQEELDAYTSAVTAGLPGAIGVGDVRYVDVDGNGELSDLGNPAEGDEGDLIELGNINPQYSFSLDFGGDYKGFDFRLLFQGVGKRTLFRGGQFSAPILGSQWFYQGARYFYGKTWTPENTDAKYPELSVNGQVNNYNYRLSENNKVNAAYVRLKNLQIGYSLPVSLLSKINISKLRLFLSGENVFEIQSKISRELNFDPESGTSSFGYPFVRTYSVGAQITF